MGFEKNKIFAVGFDVIIEAAMPFFFTKESGSSPSGKR
jgi:hypothetical protein